MGGSSGNPDKAAAPRSTVELAVVALGVWCSFLVFGWAQEALTRTEWGEGDEKERFKFTNFLVLLQSVGNALVALVLLFATEGRKVRVGGGVPVKDWLVVALGYLGAHEFGLASLRYIPFPVQVVLKSCKAIPVMLGESVFAKANHSKQKMVQVLIMCVGVAMFMLAKGDKKGKGKSDFDLYSAEAATGISLVLLALICDGIYGPYQNKISKSHTTISPYHLMFNMNAWQGLFALVICLLHGDELSEVRQFCSRHPEILPSMAGFSATMALGNLFIYRLQRYWGSLTVTITTTMRKLGSVMFSVVWFGHSMATMQWVAVCVVFLSKPASSLLFGKSKGKSESKKQD